MKIRNPRTGLYDTELKVHDAEYIQQLATKQREAQAQWWDAGIEHRIQVLKQLAQVVREHKDELSEAIAADTGRWSESVLEVDVISHTIERWCQKAPELLKAKVTQDTQIDFIELESSYLPFELVGVISPWNFPLLLSLIDAIPALLAGSAVMIKPSEVTSRFVTPFERVVAEVEGLEHILEFVIGAGDTAQDLIRASDIICFTGSVNTGLKVAEFCAKLFKPVFLELGGKDFAIVCEDADLDIAANALCWGSMVNAGQSCMSIERILVHENIAEAFKEKLVAKVKQLKHNYPDIKQGQIGPVISDKQIDVIQRQIEDAKQKGARALCGGRLLEQGGGVYFEPTILDQVTDDMLVVTDESFAALAVVQTFKTIDEALAVVNGSKYGLSGAVFSQNINQAKAIASRMRVGGISINDASLTGFAPEAEKQSFNLSGMGGSRMGSDSIYRFIRKKVFIRNTGTHSPWWF